MKQNNIKIFSLDTKAVFEYFKKLGEKVRACDERGYHVDINGVETPPYLFRAASNGSITTTCVDCGIPYSRPYTIEEQRRFDELMQTPLVI